MAGSGMHAEIRMKLEGMDTLVAGLKGFRRSLQQKYLRPHLFSAMDLLERAIKYKAAVLNIKKRGGRWMYENDARKRGLMKRSVKTQWSKLDASRGNAGVWTTVTRPSGKGAGVRARRKMTKQQRALLVSNRRKGGFGLIKRDGSRGAIYWPNDPFYFKFLEKGTKFIPRDDYNFIGRYAYGLQGEITLRTFVRRAADGISKLTAEKTK
jgi:hypothetical protein